MRRCLLQLSHDDHRAGELHKAEEVCGDVLIAYDQTAEVLDPAIESLDLVSLVIATQPTAILSGWLDSILAMRADQLRGEPGSGLIDLKTTKRPDPNGTALLNGPKLIA